MSGPLRSALLVLAAALAAGALIGVVLQLAATPR